MASHLKWRTVLARKKSKMKRRWIFGVYDCRSEFVERIFVVAYHYENAIEAIEALHQEQARLLGELCR
jgi:hypothetical protein